MKDCLQNILLSLISGRFFHRSWKSQGVNILMLVIKTLFVTTYSVQAIVQISKCTFIGNWYTCTFDIITFT